MEEKKRTFYELHLMAAVPCQTSVVVFNWLVPVCTILVKVVQNKHHICVINFL